MTNAVNKILQRDYLYMRDALNHAEMSHAVRAKVGACMVTESGVIIPGWNGRATGKPNDCEDEIDGKLVTRPDVIHAELNALIKAAKEGVSIKQATLYVSLAPCLPCASMLINAGIKKVVYLKDYRCTKGLDELRESGIIVYKLNEELLRN